MKAEIGISLNNDAFQGNGQELARVLRNLAQDVEDYNIHNLGCFIGIADMNGNTVGTFEIVEDEKS
jgi:hypothetical protein|tara:strand:+ start:335 stop:532 length:198 start_codon:yes stop_codon:yes gene_type:complete